MALRKAYLVLSLLLISVFSLNTVFGTPVDEAHPKKLQNHDSQISQLYDDSLFDVDSSATVSALHYVDIFAVLDIHSAVFAEIYQAKVMLVFHLQQRVFLSIKSRLTNFNLGLFDKLLSNHQDNTPFILI